MPSCTSPIMIPKGARAAAKLPVPSIGSMIHCRPTPAASSTEGSAAAASSPMIPASGRIAASPSDRRSSLSLSAMVT